MNTVEMPKYKCHKEVWALKIAEFIFCIDDESVVFARPSNKDFADIEISKELFDKYKPEINWYYVQYEDGYTAFSPQKAFEDGYTIKEEI